MRNIEETISKLNHPAVEELPAPTYAGEKSNGVFLAVESMREHMTDEGWQIAIACRENGYTLCGHNLEVGFTGVPTILRTTNPGVVVVQDKREWDVQRKDFREEKARFQNVQELKSRDDIFKLTILKDSHQKPLYHRESADEIGCHAWIIYYNSKIVKHLAPYVREEHLIRTYHSIDSQIVPEFKADRDGALLSGAVSGAYPLRRRLAAMSHKIDGMNYLKHPGYHRRGSNTPDYLQILNRHKVAICTSSIYGYSLRKIIEATACGCRVLTDLPTNEVMPWIDDNLVRVSPNATMGEIRRALSDMHSKYDESRQRYFAEQAKEFYDYRYQGKLLIQSIEQLRKNYNVA